MQRQEQKDLNSELAWLSKAGARTLTALGSGRYQPIHIAAQKGFLDVVKALLENKPNLIEQTDLFGQTPLLWAAAKGQEDVVEYLILKGANLNVTTRILGEDDGKTPLYWAAEQGYSTIVSMLTKAGARTTTALGIGRYQPIHIAAQKGLLNVVKALLENKPNLIEQTDLLGQTPLLWAAAKGQADVVEYLILKGANLNVTTHKPGSEDHGKTPLYWAIELGYSNVVDVMLKRIIEPNLSMTIDKLTPMIIQQFLPQLLRSDGIMNRISNVFFKNKLEQRYLKVQGEIQNEAAFFLNIYSYFVVDRLLISPLAWLTLEYCVSNINLLNQIKKIPLTLEVEDRLSKNISSVKMSSIFQPALINVSSSADIQKNRSKSLISKF